MERSRLGHVEVTEPTFKTSRWSKVHGGTQGRALDGARDQAFCVCLNLTQEEVKEGREMFGSSNCL